MWRTLKVLLLLSVFSTAAFGQKGTHTPYSIFGLGELKNNEYAAFLSMGGVSMANTDSTIVNQLNPATYSFLERNRPVFQIGLDGRFSTFSTETSSTKQRFFGLNQFQLGLPIKRNWGAAIGFKPYSFTGYAISNYTVEGEDSTELYTSEGTGAITNYFLGVSYKPLNLSYKKRKPYKINDSLGTHVDSIEVSSQHRLSIGVNGNYLAGSSDRIRTFQYWSTTLGLNSKVENSLRISDWTVDFGLTYEYRWKKRTLDGKIEKGYSMAIGAAYVPAFNVRAYQDVFSYSYVNIGGFNGAEVISDTIEFVRDNKGSLHIPEMFKGGIEFRIGPKNDLKSGQIRIGADVKYQKWSAYNEDFGSAYANQLKDRMDLALGIEWTPSTVTIDRSTPFLNKMHYRLGFNYTLTELHVLNALNDYTDLTSYGMSFGVGFPIDKNSNTNVNFGANFGNLGTTQNGLIQEKYVGVFFGISLSPPSFDRWFVKRKYD